MGGSPVRPQHPYFTYLFSKNVRNSPRILSADYFVPFQSPLNAKSRPCQLPPTETAFILELQWLSIPHPPGKASIKFNLTELITPQAEIRQQYSAGIRKKMTVTQFSAKRKPSLPISTLAGLSVNVIDQNKSSGSVK